MNYYEHHIGDYAEATAHLTFVEDAAYSRLLRKYYATEKPIPADIKVAQRLVGARTREERAAVEQVLQEFFERRDDGWHQKRCDDEIAEYQAGEPEREQKRVNKDARMKRHRIIRAAFFDALRSLGQHPAWDTKTDALRDLVKRAGLDPETVAATATATRPETPPATPPATAPATPATATQSPVPIHQSPVPSPQTPETGNSVGEAAVAAPPDADGKRPKVARPPCPPDVDPQVWADWLALRKAKRAPVTATVIADAESEARKAGMSLEAFLREWCGRGSQGLKAEWLKPNGSTYAQRDTDAKRERVREMTSGLMGGGDAPKLLA